MVLSPTTLSTVTLLLSFLTLAAFGTPIHSKRQSLATVYSQCTVPKTVAITFDDGPYLYLKQISDTLTSAGAKGTFFFNGNNFGCIYTPANIESVQYAYKAGHQVASHTWSHGDLTTFTNDQIHDGMYRMEEAFSRIIGVKPAFMRPPYGSWNDNVRTVAGARGQSLALWNFDTGDADGNSTAQQEAVYSSGVNSHVSTMLVLNHETEETTATTLIPYAVKTLQNAGYKLVTLAECLGNLPAYTQVGVPQTQDPTTWTCTGTPAPGAACSGTQCKTGTVNVNQASSPPPASNPPSPPPSSSTPGQPIHPKSDSSKCLAATSNANGSPVTIQPCDGSSSQSWSVTSSGTIQIYSDKCLDVTSGLSTNGNKMQIYACNTGNANQQWTTGTGGVIQWKGHSSCLDNTGGVLTAGNPTQLWTCSSTNVNQQWVIGSASSSPPPSSPSTSGKLIKPSSSSSSCLTVQSNSNNAAVTIQPCVANSPSQLWTPTSSGTLTIYSGSKCLDVPSGSTTNGVKLQVYDCNKGNANQAFGVGANGVITWSGKGECVDLTDGSVAAGNKVQMWSCSNGNRNQVWTLA